MKEGSLFRFAHISDLHFSQVCLNPSQFFSKRWVGNLNLFLNRNKKFDTTHLYTLIPLFQELKVDGILLTGDLTSTSYRKEFEKAKKFISALLEKNFKIFLIPGNHDHYTYSACSNKIFYKHFNYVNPSSCSQLKDDKIARIYLGEKWWIFALDSAEHTSLFSSHGVFSKQLEKNLEHALSSLAPDQNVIVINHFPLFETNEKKSLRRSDVLCALLRRFSQVKLYLHGHTHRHIVADLRPSGLPILMDSGSTSVKKEGSWNLIDITTEGCAITMYKKPMLPSFENWQRQKTAHFSWTKA